jgi:hypothetical protein
MHWLTLAAALAADPPQLAATFYPWYEWRDGALSSPDPRPLRQRPLLPAASDATAVEWLDAELDAAAAAGIDTLLVANVPAPARFEATMRALGRALADRAVGGAPPIRVGLLLEPHFAALDLAGGAGAAAVPPIDLREPTERDAFLAPLAHFFAEIPSASQAQFRGGPLVVIGNDGAIAACPPDFFDVLEREAPDRYGATPTLVIDPSWNLEARPQWRRGAPLLGPQRRGAIATLGPGWLDEDAGRGMIRPPGSRSEFLGEAQRLLAEAAPELLIVESWNQFHDGSAVAPTLSHGTRYGSALRRVARALREPGRAATWEVASPREPLLARAWHAGRAAVLANAVDWRADGDGSGIELLELLVDRSVANATLPRADPKSDRLVLPPAGVELVFEVPAPFRRLTAADHELKIETHGACDWRVRTEGDGDDSSTPPQVEVRADPGGSATLRLESWSSRSRPRLRLTAQSATELVRVTLTRLEDRLPEGGLGIDDPELFPLALLGANAANGRAADAWEGVSRRVAAAAALGASWLRFELDLARLPAATGGTIDWSVATRLVAAIRDRGLQPIAAISSLPAGSPPLGADPESVADLLSGLRAACGEGLRVVELFPGANRPSRFARAPDLPGFLRAVRAVAGRLHVEAPDLALVGGGIAGPDLDWCDSFRALREPWHLDASALEVDDRYGAAGGPTEAGALTAMVESAAARPGLPGVLTLAASASPSTPERLARNAQVVSVAGALVREAMTRRGLAGTPIHLLEPDDLPRVGGFSTPHARAVLAAAGSDVETLTLVPLVGAIGDGRARVAAVASGERWPAELIAVLPSFLDRGGMLIALGGPPAIRSAALSEGAGFELGGAELGLALHDDFRIGLVPWERTLDPIPPGAGLRAGRTFPGFVPPTAELPLSALFRRRGGEPRDPRGYHRYDELLTLHDSGGEPVADVGVLLHYQGGREGALLLLGFAGETGLPDRDAQAGDFAAQLRAIAKLPAAARRIVLWRGLTDTADSAHGLLDGAFAETAAATIFRQAR